MLGDFEAIVSRRDTQRTIPRSVIEYLSSELPEGIHYELDEDGKHLVCAPDAPLETDGIRLNNPHFVLDEVGEKAFNGIEKTEQNIFRYLRNSQKPVKVEADGAFRVINGTEIPLEDTVVELGADRTLAIADVYIFPPKPHHFKTLLTADGVERELEFVQQTTESVFEERYVHRGGSLLVSLEFNVNDGDLMIITRTSFEDAESASEYLETLRLRHCMMVGNYSLNGRQISRNDNSAKPFISAATDFWSKVIALEELLQKSFDIHVPFGEKTVRNVNILYRCLVQKKAIRQHQGFKDVSGVGVIDDEQLGVGQEAMLIVPKRATFVIFDQTIDLNCVVGLFGVVIGGVWKNLEEIDADGYYPFRIDLLAREHTLYSELFLLDSTLEDDNGIDRYHKALAEAEDLEFPSGSVF